jgi:hypothetical protein
MVVPAVFRTFFVEYVTPLVNDLVKRGVPNSDIKTLMRAVRRKFTGQPKVEEADYLPVELAFAQKRRRERIAKKAGLKGLRSQGGKIIPKHAGRILGEPEGN